MSGLSDYLRASMATHEARDRWAVRTGEVREAANGLRFELLRVVRQGASSPVMAVVAVAGSRDDPEPSPVMRWVLDQLADKLPSVMYADDWEKLRLVQAAPEAEGER